MRVGIVGECGAGKSMLAYSFSRHIIARGLSCTVANFDVFCKHAFYTPDFDCRKLVAHRGIKPADAESFLEECYYRFSRDESVAAVPMSASTCVMDCRGGAGFFTSTRAGEFLRKRSDIVLLVSDATRLQGSYSLQVQLAKALESATGVPTVAVLNKWDQVRSVRQNTLFSTAAQGVPDGAVAASAREGVGLDELFYRGLNGKRAQAVRA